MQHPSPSNFHPLYWRYSCAAETGRINKSAAPPTPKNTAWLFEADDRRDPDAHFNLLQVLFLA
jgi:hypothetical protein